MSWFKKFFRSWWQEREGFLPAAELRGVLERERMRADRAGGEFSLLTLTPSSPPTVERDLDLLATILNRRLRATDQAGWLDRQRVGVLLPDTSAPGAWKVADDVYELFAAQAAHRLLDCDVSVYPSHTPPTGDGQPEVDESVSAAVRSCAPSRPVKPLEALFVRRLPIHKRLIDVVGAVVGLVLFLPVLLATAVAVKWTSPGPVLFRQRRDGIGGKPFTVYKFRTMHIDAEQRKAELLALSEQDGPAFKLRNDPRLTPIGSFLRKTCIDELPQFWNVLRGEMSLVGPRPMDSNESRQCSGWERRRLDVTPGLTCIWQVHGGAKVTFAEWMRMDIRYIRARSLWRDAKLLLQTFVAVLFYRASC